MWLLKKLILLKATGYTYLFWKHRLSDRILSTFFSRPSILFQRQEAFESKPAMRLQMQAITREHGAVSAEQNLTDPNKVTCRFRCNLWLAGKNSGKNLKLVQVTGISSVTFMHYHFDFWVLRSMYEALKNSRNCALPIFTTWPHTSQMNGLRNWPEHFRYFFNGLNKNVKVPLSNDVFALYF